jgi:CheY-like chemotaxis protein
VTVPRPLVALGRGLFALAVPGVALRLSLALRPLIGEVAAPTGRRGRGESVGARGAALLVGLRLLVVEDHRDTAELMRTVLESHGATVRPANSRAGALAALAGLDVDVLLSDIAMTDGTGYELVHRLRALERARGHRPIVAVAVTACAGAEDRERAAASGFQHFATKPIEPVDLVETVARAAGRASIARRGRTP